MVQCLSAFMEACYIVHQNTISAPMLDRFQKCVDKFHELQNIFIILGVCSSISLPRQHALAHYFYSIQLFSSPNGLCLSITESKHIKAVKEPWRQSSHYKALSQMLKVLMHMHKMLALHRQFAEWGMMAGTTSSYMASICRKFLRHLIRLRPCNVDCRNYQALPFHGKPDEMNVGQIRGAATLQSDRSPL